MNKSFSSKLLFYVQRYSHDINLRNFLNSIIGKFLPSAKKRLSGTDFLNTGKSEEQILQDLKNNGYSELGITLSESIVADLKLQLDNLPCYKFDKKDGRLVDFNNTDASVQLGNYDRNDLAGIPEIISIANDKKILNAIAKYLGVKPTISNINCWWSFARREKPKEAQFFHRDVDDFKFLKLFVYLTDVVSDSGPHVYVKGSHKVNKLIELKRFKDEEVAHVYPAENVISFERPKGTCFIVDTYGIHKGLLPINTNRLLLQVQYSYFPLYVETYTPLNKSISEQIELDPYVNRLIFTS